MELSKNEACLRAANGENPQELLEQTNPDKILMCGRCFIEITHNNSPEDVTCALAASCKTLFINQIQPPENS